MHYRKPKEGKTSQDARAWGFSTRAIHAGQEPNMEEGGSGDVVVPIHMASTFARKDTDAPTGGYEYSRTGNPTRAALEEALASLEGARFGLAFASGLAAIDAVLKLMQAGDHVVCCDDLYGGTRRLFSQVWERYGISFSFVDASRTEEVVRALRPETRMIWLETPTNPLLKLCDIRAISNAAKENDKDIMVAVDNTFLSPYFQRPLEHGADIVVHSTTKYLGGHSDVVGGAVATNNSSAFERLRFLQNAAGAVPSPFDSWLVLRGIKTLAVRMERHERNAQAVAEFLEKHPQVERVFYPGLSSHPQHNLARRQMSGMGGMISFVLKGGMPAAKAFLSSLSVFLLAESLGGVESLIEHPASMTHASVPLEVREEIGISDGLIRISVGIEDIGDLLDDLRAGFAEAQGPEKGVV